jgi:hypothetical protein
MNIIFVLLAFISCYFGVASYGILVFDIPGKLPKFFTNKITFGLVCISMFITTFYFCVEMFAKEDTYYRIEREGYQKGINTKFEQRIDTVYIKKN